MADPFTAIGVAASVATIASEGFKLFQELKAYADQVKRADEVMRRIIGDINSTAVSLEQLGENLAEEQTHKRMFSPKPSMQSILADGES